MDLWHIFQEPWAIRALIASTMVGVTCGVLGVFIVLRNMALIGDALSHAILPGVAVSFIFLGYNTLGFFFGSVAAGLISAVAITWIQHNVRTKPDAVIGIVFTAMFSLGVIGISIIAKMGAHLDLKDFLFGNVLGVANQDIVMNGIVLIVVCLTIILFYRQLFASTFQPTIATTMGIPVKLMHYYLMLLLSFSVVAAMQTVGVILVVAMLITPASTALLLAVRLPKVLLLAGISGFISSITGLVLSVLIELPPGPAIAVTATVIYLIVAFIAPERGLLARWIRKKRQEKKIQSEDVLKEAFKISLSNPVSLSMLSDRLSLSPVVTKRFITKLVQRNLMHYKDSGQIELTREGNEYANSLIRAHRLWESYLVHEMGMDAEHIHPEAEHFEHILTADQVDEVDKKLGYPALDPHGSPIPSKSNIPALALVQLKASDQGIIAQRQPGAEITYKLWDLGLGPGDVFRVISNHDGYKLLVKEEEITIPAQLAGMISVEKENP